MTRVGFDAIQIEEDGVRVRLDVEGDDEDAVQRAAMDLKDRAVRVLNALTNDEEPDHPDDAEGAMMRFDWEGYVAGEYDQDGEDEELATDGGVE
jgi:hypothetical protein